MIKKTFYKYSEKSTLKKCELFFNLMNPSPEDILVDAGGGIGEGFNLIWRYFKKVIVIDINPKAIEYVNRKFNNVEGIVGDVCNMPLKDKSVDYLFSNAVIEHIDKNKRFLFANEVRRVTRKGYFITTPNFFFPFEPHYLCPFFQYLPESVKKIVKKYVSLGHFRKGCYEKIDLLTKKRTAKIFS